MKKCGLSFRYRVTVTIALLTAFSASVLIMLLDKAEDEIHAQHGHISNVSEYQKCATMLKEGLSRGDYHPKRLISPTGKLNVSRTQNDTVKLACQIPKLVPFDKSIKHHIIEPKPLQCKGILSTYINKNKLVIDQSVARKMKHKFCYVSTIDRVTDFKSKISSPVKIKIDRIPSEGDKHVPIQYNISTDFTVVGCGNDTNFPGDKRSDISRDDIQSFYNNYNELFDVHASIVPYPTVKERLRTIKPPTDGLGLNVIMLGLESTSRMNFIRQLPKTYKLLESLGTMVYEGYNIVADGTTGAILALLAGKTEFELPEVRKGKKNSTFVNIYPLIWKDFAKNGYVTMFAEDAPHLAMFNLRLNGFDKLPTDHYMRNLWNAVKVKNHCLGSKPVHKVMLDYLMDYMTIYNDVPHFGFSFIAGLTHDDINPLKLMDGDLYRFLSNTKQNGLLNNTILLLFGDHGSRYARIRQSFQGKLEERLPFFSITLPDWIAHRYPDLYTNLVKNKNRLLTPFDAHETLKSVLHYRYSVKPGNGKQRGISIFNEIPKERTCADADIAPHWCSCLTWEPANLEQTNQLAEAFVNIINTRTHQVRDKCAKFKLGKVLRAEKMVPNAQVLRFKQTQGFQQPSFSGKSTVNINELPILFQVTVQTLPGNALFEGTLRLLPQNKKSLPHEAYEITEDISRINRYGNQADCILDSQPHLGKFCFCRNDTAPKPQ